MINIDNLSKSYGRKQIFSHLNTTFHPNTLTILLGENGAGKSTLLRMIAQLEQPDTGSIRYSNIDTSHLKSHIGYIPQDIALFEHLSADDNIKVFKSLYRNTIDDETINRYALKMNLKDRNEPVSKLSGGTKRKVNLLIGLLGDPEILILDEPTVGIDLKSRHEIHQLLLEMKSYKLMIMTTHHLDEITAVGDTIKVIGKDPFYKEVLTHQQIPFESLLD